MTPLHQITLPLNDNAGAALTEAHAKLSRAIVGEAGGCTTFDASGQWLTDTGHVQAEPVRCYQVACDVEVWRSIVRLSKVLFPDQLAIFHATIGAATIEDGLAAIKGAA